MNSSDIQTGKDVATWPVDVQPLVEKCLAPWRELIVRSEADRG